MKKSLLSLAVAAAIGATPALAYNTLEERAASGSPADFNSSDPLEYPFELTNEALVSSDTIATSVVLESKQVDGAIAETPVGDQAPSVSGTLAEQSGAGDSPAMSFPVTVTGSVPVADDACSVSSVGSMELDFGSGVSFSRDSSGIAFQFACGVDKVSSADLYASTNSVDPEVGDPSAKLAVTFTPDPISGQEAFEIEIDLSDAGGNLGTSTPISTISGGGSEGIVVSANIGDEAYSQMNGGGEITTGSGDSTLYFWIK